MTDFLSISELELEERRRRLRQQRRWKAVQAVWRSLLVTGMTVGVVWGATSQIWLIRSPAQVKIEGITLLSPQTLHALLPIRYPQSPLFIEPEAIAKALEEKAPVANVQVTRNLYPPQLIIKVQERHPVAIAYPSIGSQESMPPAQGQPNALPQAVLLDEKGFWISLDRYTTLEQTLALPTLTVIGMRDEYRSQWSSFYHTIARSPVAIYEIDWRNPVNLILKTELGSVHIGPYTHQLPQQLAALDRMRNLSQTLDINQVAYIDIQEPDHPLVQMIQPLQPNQPPTLPPSEP